MITSLFLPLPANTFHAYHFFPIAPSLSRLFSSLLLPSILRCNNTDSFLSNFKFQFSCAERLNFKRGQDEPTRDENYALIHS